MSNVKVTKEQVENFIESYDISTIKDKTTVVVATLKNGFVIVESSSCVDPANYDEKIGADICKEKIEDQVWHLLGFNLQQKQYEQTPVMPYKATPIKPWVSKKCRAGVVKEVIDHTYPKCIFTKWEKRAELRSYLSALSDEEFENYIIKFSAERLTEYLLEKSNLFNSLKRKL